MSKHEFDSMGAFQNVWNKVTDNGNDPRIQKRPGGLYIGEGKISDTGLSERVNFWAFKQEQVGRQRLRIIEMEDNKGSELIITDGEAAYLGENDDVRRKISIMERILFEK
jgi:hypothetical protein